jgi:putative DNA primase/helicase
VSAAVKLTLIEGGPGFGGPAVDDRALADYGRDDIGNAERLRARHGQDLRRCPGLGVLVFDGQRWKLDPETSHALLRAQLTARAIFKEAKAIQEEAGETAETAEKKQILERAASHRKWATQTANSQRLNAMLAQAWPHLEAPLEAWNAKPALFNVANGTLDLSTGEVKLGPHRRDDLNTHLAGVAYDEHAEAPAFRDFLDRVLPGEPVTEKSDALCVRATDGKDYSLQHFVRRCLGACLIDSVKDQAIVVFHGGGANGKSTLLNSVASVLGDYCMTVAVQSLLYSEQSGSNASPDVARLAEKPRLVRVSEPEPGAKLSEGGVKSLTGGEPIVARKLHEAPIEFQPNFKIVLSCNNRPSIRGGDDGIWRRILLVPWKVQIPPEEQREKGPALEADLKREAPGILNWLIEGLLDYYERGGLAPPDAVTAETLAYRTDSDVIGRFISECCEKGDGLDCEGGELYYAYVIWAREEGSKEPLSANLVGRRLTDRGFGRRKSSSSVYRLGLDLLPEWKTRVRSGDFKKKSKVEYAAAKDGEPGGEE